MASTTQACFWLRTYSNKGLNPKDCDFYRSENKRFIDYEVDHQWLLENLDELNEMTDVEANKHIFVKEKYNNKAEGQAGGDNRPQ